MEIKTNKVKGRRTVQYDSLDDLYADAQRLAGADTRALGNWSQGQIYEHLARALDSSIDGIRISMPAPVRWAMSMFFKRRFLKKAIPPGFTAPAKQLIPEETSVEDGLASLQTAIERQKAEPLRAPHPVFGNIGRDGWDDFNLRHAEMHMSFLVNGQSH